jgi:hypothetical protein
MRILIKKILKENYDPEDTSWVDNIITYDKIKDDADRYEIILDVIETVETYKGWRIKYEADGVLYWYGPERGYYGLATPEWSNTNEIPVDISGDRGYETIATIKTPEFEYVQEVKIWYQNNYFETVYRLLTNYINHGDTPGIIDMT